MSAQARPTVAPANDPRETIRALEAELLARRSRFEELAASDENSFLPYDEAAWRRAVDVVTRLTMRLRAAGVDVSELPDLLPAGSDSIDIEWEMRGRDLLVNVPPDSGRPVYGRREGSPSIKGTLASREDEDLLIHWLTGRPSGA